MPPQFFPQGCSAAWYSTCYPQSPRGGSSSCLQSAKTQSAMIHWDYFFAAVGFSISLCWTLRGSCQPISPGCQSASEWQETHLLHQVLLPDFCCVLPLLRCYFVPLARSLEMMLNSSGLSKALWLITTAFRGTLCGWSHSHEPSRWATSQSISLSSYLAWNATGWLKHHMSTMDGESKTSSSCLKSYNPYNKSYNSLQSNCLP